MSSMLCWICLDVPSQCKSTIPNASSFISMREYLTKIPQYAQGGADRAFCIVAYRVAKEDLSRCNIPPNCDWVHQAKSKSTSKSKGKKGPWIQESRLTDMIHQLHPLFSFLLSTESGVVVHAAVSSQTIRTR